MPRTAFITGATGFIGSRLVRRLLEDGWLVHALVRTTPVTPAPGVFLHYHGDSVAALREMLQAVHPDVVFHLASLFLVRHRSEDIEGLLDSNICLGLRLAEAMANTGTINLVNAGTTWQHYHGEAYNPACLYAATKQASEDLLRFYAEAGMLRVLNLTLPDTYGPDDHRKKLWSLLATTAVNGQPVDLSPGEQLIDLIHADDAAAAFVVAAERLLLETGSAWESRVATSGRWRSLREIVAIFEKAIGQPLPLRWGGRPYREREMLIAWTNGIPLENWTPRISLDDGFRQLLAAKAKPASD
jgi:nucleoside-diphosphate-sugar epimerase